MTKKLKGISSFYDNQTPENIKRSPELLVREAYLRATRENFDGAGIESYTLERQRGMLDLLEQFNFVREEL